MLGLIYVLAMFAFGSALERLIFRFERIPERIAGAFLVGLVLGTWITYLAAAAVPWPIDRMIAGNLVFLVIVIATIGLAMWLSRRHKGVSLRLMTGESKWDWILLGVFFLASAWLMFASFGFASDEVVISYLARSDFGANLAIAQSFTVGNNFPTEYPLFSGETIRNHFLFWFQAGNLYYLGLHPVWGINLLSILSVTSLLTLIIGLGERLFGSRAAGRIAACLFFVHGSLSYIQATWQYPDISTAIGAFISSKKYLTSGLPYHGEDWGLWSLNVYINQRHLISAIGIMALALYWWAGRIVPSDEGTPTGTEGRRRWWKFAFGQPQLGFMLCGLLIGLLPMWNGPVFLSAMIVVGILLLLLPGRANLLVMLVVAVVVAMPQLLYLRPEVAAAAQSYPMFSWGFNVVPPTAANVTWYLANTFGFKLLLILLALFLINRVTRSFFVALFGLVLVAFTFKFSFEVLTNHKFLNIWLIFANLFAAYSIYRLWKWSIGGKLIACILLALIIPGGLIDVFPIRNEAMLRTKFDKEYVVEWLVQNTEPSAVFLTDHYVDQHFMFAGRKIFQGYTYFTSAAGYEADKRQVVYKEMLTSKDPGRVIQLLKANGIDYVVFDDSLRRGQLKGQGNEELYARHFRQVFPNEQKQYENLKIYRIAEQLDPIDESVINMATPEATPPPPISNPRGIAVDPKGDYLVADTGNGVIQKFGSDGKPSGTVGRVGSNTGEMREPNGLAIDGQGNLFVADAGWSKLLKFDQEGNFVNEWRPLDGGFYGPRDIAFGPNGMLYIVDQGRTRIVVFDPKAEVFIRNWGTSGSGESQFNEPTGVVVGGNHVYVMDTGNDRVQVFDLDGKFLRSWEIPAWRSFSNRYPDAAFDEKSKLLYITSSGTNEVLVYGENGNQLKTIVPPDQSRLSNPSAIVLRISKAARELLVLNNASATVSRIPLE